MKSLLGWLPLLLAVGLVGCASTENRTQLHVIGRPALRGLRMPVTPQDRDAVKDVVLQVAAQLKCEDRTSASFNPNVIASFAQEDRTEPFTVEAYAHQDFIVVDLRHAPTSIGETKAYRQVRDTLYEALRAKFGARLLTPTQMQYVRNIKVPATTTMP
jgi:hypothetical protein